MTKVPASVISAANALPGLETVAFWQCLHLAFPHACMERELSRVSSTSSKDTSPIGLGPHADDFI